MCTKESAGAVEEVLCEERDADGDRDIFGRIKGGRFIIEKEVLRLLD